MSFIINEKLESKHTHSTCVSAAIEHIYSMVGMKFLTQFNFSSFYVKYIHTNSNSLAIDQRLILFLNLSNCLKRKVHEKEIRIWIRRVDQLIYWTQNGWEKERFVWPSWFFHFTNKTDWLQQQIVYTQINKSVPSEKEGRETRINSRNKDKDNNKNQWKCVCVFGHVYTDFSWNASANEPCVCVEWCKSVWVPWT